MNRWSSRFFFSIALLAALGLTALPQAKTKSHAAPSSGKSSGKPVTVTLVRWPYT